MRKAIFVETAFRDPHTGKVYGSGPIHRPTEAVPRDVWKRHGGYGDNTIQAGFVDRRGKFFTRDQARSLANRYDRATAGIKSGYSRPPVGDAPLNWSIGYGESRRLRATGAMDKKQFVWPPKEEEFVRHEVQRSRTRRKSAKESSGGDVQVSSYTRDGHEVGAYTRSRPGR